MKIAKIETIFVNSCEYTNWAFVRVETDSGLIGIGEATMQGADDLLQAAVEALARELVGKDARRIIANTRIRAGAPGGRVYYAAISGVEQALWDIAGKDLGAPVHRLLGGAVRDKIPVYANLNRGTRDRTPEGFAASARNAVADGFKAVKVTPFDGVKPGDLVHPEGRKRVDLGLERVAKARAAIGPDIALMVDCHWRFTAAEAIRIARELEPFNVFWIEDMSADTDLEAWARFHQQRPEQVAGGERMVGLPEFDRFIKAGVWDVVCPDVKFCGGLMEAQRIGALAEANDLLIAPHNPSGPVSTMASAHLVATMPNLLMLEYAWGECSWRNELLQGAEKIVDGFLELPMKPGLGFELSPTLLAAHPYQEVVPLSTLIGLAWT